MKKMWAGLPLIAVGVLLPACQDGVNPGATDTGYYTNARIIDEHPLIASGDSIVFHRYFRAEDEENVADDEYAEDLLFQVPTGLTSFSYKDEDLDQLKVTIKPYCFCGLPEGTVVERGTLSGQKAGSVWQVSADVELRFIYRYEEDSVFTSPETITRTFSATFPEKPIPNGN